MFKVVIRHQSLGPRKKNQPLLNCSLLNMRLTNYVNGYHGTFHLMASHKTNQLMYGGRCAMGYMPKQL